MRKISYIEERNTQQFNQFLASLSVELPKIDEKLPFVIQCGKQYEMLVGLTFSANVLYRGLTYASELYNHIVKLEYKRLKKELLKKELDVELEDQVLRVLRRTRNRLLQESPLVKEAKGVEQFYLLTGGNRQKYVANRRAIKRMYLAIESQMSQSIFIYFIKKFSSVTRQKKKAILWQIKSRIWR